MNFSFNSVVEKSVILTDDRQEVLTENVSFSQSTQTFLGVYVGNEYGYTGRRHDSEGSGLMYFRARYYSGELGRFVGRDPFGTINHLGLKGKHFGDLPAGLYYTNGYSLYRAYFVPNSSDYTGMYDPNKMQFCLDFLEGFFVPGPPPPTPGGVAGGASSQALDALINIENTPTEPKPGDWGGGLCNTNVDNTRKFGTKNTCKNHCTDPITCDVWDVPGEYIEVWKCQPSIIGRGGGCWAKVAEFQKCDLCI